MLAGPDEGGLAGLMDLGKKLGIRENIIFAGRLDGKDLVSAYHSCDVFAMSSYCEAFCLSLLEAQAAGKPVVAGDCGGVLYVVKNGETGLLIPPQNDQRTRGFADALNLLLGDEKMTSKMGNETRKWAQNFRWENLTRRILSLYVELLG